jgi:hypothetical protein
MSSTLTAAVNELEAAGITYTVSRKRKHYKLHFKVRGQLCLVVVSASASDHRAALNARQDVRRAIRRAIDQK